MERTEEGLSALGPTGRRGARLVLVVVLVATFPAWSAPALAAQPSTPAGSLGAYTEPAPKAQAEQRAGSFVNELLKREGSRERVSTAKLRTGVVLQAPPITPTRASARPEKQSTSSRAGQPPAKTRSSSARPALDLGPAERAGASAPASQHVPSPTIGFVIAAVLAAMAMVYAGGRALGGSTSHERHHERRGYSPPS
jgi:hypothetical protein